jgi:hypothetical protein
MTDTRDPPDGPDDDDLEGHDPEALERQRILGAQLGKLWDIEEGIPDDFKDLLDKFDDRPERA